MYVRKFEAESLEEALKEIKMQLGPDAIILKTVTNKGLKGAFKKNRIEITAAISEKNYTKKSRVDHILNDDQKQKFYNNNSKYVSQMIDGHSDNKQNEASTKPGYGNISLNRPVVSVKQASPENSGLDDFLKLDKVSESGSVKSSVVNNFSDHVEHLHKPLEDEKLFQEVKVNPLSSRNDEYDEIINEQRIKVMELEKKIFELSKIVSKVGRKEPVGIYHLREKFKCLDINDTYADKIVKKLYFDIDENGLMDIDNVFEQSLRYMFDDIKTDQALFSKEMSGSPVVTVFLSDNSSGQSTLVQKIAVMKEGSVVIRNDGEGLSLCDKLFNLNIVNVKTISEVVSEARKAIESGKNVFIDFKDQNKDESNVKKFIDGLKRSFDKVEVLITLSAIHSEIYNKKVLSGYQTLADGIVISNIDQCLNFGSLFNISVATSEHPFKFYSTGQVVPDDLEGATAERILAGIFNL